MRASVSKGLVQLRLDGFKQIGCVLLTGQSVALDWDESRQLLDISRSGGERLVVVSLPDRSTASLGTSGILRFSREDTTAYSVAALGGQVTLWDVSSDQVTGLTAQKVVRSVESPIFGLVTKVHFMGDQGKGFRIRINGGAVYGFEEVAKTQGVLKLDGLEFHPSEGGSRWTVRSWGRPAEVTGESLGSWKAEVPLGEAATFAYSPSSSWVKVFTGEGSNKRSRAVVVMRLAQEGMAAVGPYSSAKSDLSKALRRMEKRSLWMVQPSLSPEGP